MATKKDSVAVDVTSTGSVAVSVPEGIPELKELTTQADGISFTPTSFEQVFEHFGGELVEIEGSPYKVVKKDQLVNVGFVITDVRFYEGTYGPAVAICGITRDNELFVFNDGSTGIFEAIKATVAKTGRRAGILVANGLRASHYKKEIVDGMTDEVKEIDATTYYFA